MTNEYATLFTARDTRNYYVFNGWMLAATVSFIAATILLKGKFIPPAAGWALTALTAGLLVMTVCTYMAFLRQADELLRKVHLEALAIGFGTGVVLMMVYRLCERLGAPKLDVNDAALVMILTWIAAQFLGSRRYAAGAEER